MASFSWGSSNNNNTNNNNNNNNNTNNNNTSNGFSWGNNNSNNSNPWGNKQSNQSNQNNQNNQNNANNNNNNNNNNSWSWGNNNNSNNNSNNSGNKGGEGWNSNNNSFGSSSFNNNNNSNNNNSNVLNPNNDHIVTDTASDAISNVKFHPNRSHFIVSSWDSSISYYEFFGNNQTKKLGEQKHSKPVLDCCFDGSGDNVISAGCDNLIKIWNPQQNKFINLGQHSAPIRCVEYAKGANFAISGSWDCNISFWDIRSAGNGGNGGNKSIFTQNLGNKIYAMAQCQNYLVVALSDNDIKTFDLRNGCKEIHSLKAECSTNSKAVALKKQIRCIDIFPDCNGYVSASIGGRVIIKHFDRNRKSNNDFSYKCHRHFANGNKSTSHIFGVNVTKFHGQSGIFATGGDDGEIVTWDKDGRAKLFTFEAMKINNYRNNSGNNNHNIDNSKMPIVSLDYHQNGQYMVYATSYNWNKGKEFNDIQQQKPHVYLHQINRKELDKNKK